MAERHATYGFLFNQMYHLFLQVGNIDPDELGTQLARAYGRLSDEEIDEIKRLLSRLQPHAHQGVESFGGDLLQLVRNDELYHQILIGSPEYASSDWVYIFDLDDGSLVFNSSDRQIIEAHALLNLRHNLESVVEDLRRTSLEYNEFEGMIDEERIEEIEYEEQLEDLDFNNVIEAPLPICRDTDPISHEPIGDYFLKCGNPDPETVHYFDAENYMRFCKEGSVSCARCPVDRTYFVDPQVYRAEPRPIQIHTLEELDSRIDQRLLYIRGNVYIVETIESNMPSSLILTVRNVISGNRVRMILRGEERFEIEVNDTRFISPIFLL